MIKKLFLGLVFSFFAFGSLNAIDAPVRWKVSAKKVSACEYDLVFSAIIEKPWHIYSIYKPTEKNAEDLFPTEVKVLRSNQYELVGKLKESTPIKEYDKIWEAVVGYHPEKATFTQRIKLNERGKIKIKATTESQACTDVACTKSLVDEYEVEVESSTLCNETTLKNNKLQQEVPVHWKFSSKKVNDCEYDLIFDATVDKNWHLYSLNKPKVEGPNPTVFSFKKSSDFELVGKMSQSKPHVEYDSMWEAKIESYDKTAQFVQRVKLLTSSKIKVKGKYEFQACNASQCIFPPKDDFEFELEGSASCGGNSTASNTVAEEDTTQHTSITAAALDTTLNHRDNTALKESHYNKDEVAATSLSWWAIFLAGFVGGFAALLTPCVFPMIPMNVSFFTKQSKTKKEGIRNALVFALFIIVLYVGLGLGVTLIFGAGALHTLSTNVWFNLAFFALLLIFAASFLGAFEIVLPSSFVNKMDAKADKGGYIGIFFMAFTLALVSFSCTGPIIGTLLVEAAGTGNLAGPFWGMFGFALALALPFGLLAAFPGWLNSLPQSGGWLNSVKVTLGFLELALALKFASNADLVLQKHILTREVFIGLWIVIFGLLGVYLIGGFKTSHDSDVKSLSVTRLTMAIIAFFVTIYMIPGMWGAPLQIFSGILPPLEYSESPHGFGGSQTQNGGNSNESKDAEFGKFIEVNKNGIAHFKNDYANALAYAKKVGKPLMIDFTGHACANCRKTEDYVWPDAEVTKKLNNDVVLVSLYVDDKRELDPKDYMKVQWYGKEREITDIGDKFKYMEETLYGQSTQPLYILLDHNEKPLNAVRGYNPSIEEYVKWMEEGINNFKNSKK